MKLHVEHSTDRSFIKDERGNTIFTFLHLYASRAQCLLEAEAILGHFQECETVRLVSEIESLDHELEEALSAPRKVSS